MKKKIRCAGIIFYDKGRVLLEDRRKICKHGEHWSFFGGVIEKGETIKKALLREIKEELNFKLGKYKFFKKYEFSVKNMHLTYYMYIAPIPDLKKLKPHKKAKIKIITIKQALRLKIMPIDKKILRDLKKFKAF